MKVTETVCKFIKKLLGGNWVELDEVVKENTKKYSDGKLMGLKHIQGYIPDYCYEDYWEFSDEKKAQCFDFFMENYGKEKETEE